MRFLSLLFAAVVSRMAAAELSFTASAVHQGRKVDTSGLEFVPIPPRSKGHFRHGNGTYSGRNSTSGGGGHHRRSSVSSSSDWCGVSQHSTAQNPITSVYGVFSAPSLSFRPNLPYPQSGAAWVGIDGASCQTALLQAGITTVLNSNGQQSASAFWEWVPNTSYSISGFPVHAGEWVSVKVSASTPTNGVIEITNFDQDYTLTLVLNGGPTLCRTDADWIIEDFFDAKGKQVPFGRFDDVWFEECVATTAQGNQIGLDGASMIYMGSSLASASCVAQPYDNSNFYCTSQN